MYQDVKPGLSWQLCVVVFALAISAAWLLVMLSSIAYGTMILVADAIDLLF